MSNDISIRFYKDHKVRAIWDEKNENGGWLIKLASRSTPPYIVRVFNVDEDYKKAGNYWLWLKKKLTADGIQLVSVTHEFKFMASDGKQRAVDALDAEAVQTR